MNGGFCTQCNEEVTLREHGTCQHVRCPDTLIANVGVAALLTEASYDNLKKYNRLLIEALRPFALRYKNAVAEQKPEDIVGAMDRNGFYIWYRLEKAAFEVLQKIGVEI